LRKKAIAKSNGGSRTDQGQKASMSDGGDEHDNCVKVATKVVAN
jgi:hypothetical protein